MKLHRVIWNEFDARGHPMEKVEYFEEGEERFIDRRIEWMKTTCPFTKRTPRAEFVSVMVTDVEWRWAE